MVETLDTHAVSRELLRAWRGRRSQPAQSRRLGYSSNVAYTWEAGRRYPTAAEALRCAALGGRPPALIWERFHGTRPAWLDRVAADTPDGVAAALSDLRGRTPIDEIADRAQLSRFAVSRALSGQTQPRLPAFLRLIDALSLRLLDWLAAAAPVERLPSMHAAWNRLEAQRRAAYALPWTQAVLRAIELASYRQLPAHDDAWIARRLGVPDALARDCLAALAAGGQITWTGSHWTLAGSQAMDTRQDRTLDARNKQFWARTGLEQLAAGSAGQFSYNVFSVSQRDLERLRRLHLGYFRQLRSIVAESTPSERVAVANVQLFALDPGPLGPSEPAAHSDATAAANPANPDVTPAARRLPDTAG